MKSRWRIFILLLALFCILAVSVMICHDISTAHSSKYGSFTADDAVSSDGKYIAHQRVVKPDGYTAKMICVEVCDSSTDEMIDSFIPARAWDFWGICWEENSHNIWIQSSDIGVFCYEEQNGKWVLNAEAERPSSIVTKYDLKKME